MSTGAITLFIVIAAMIAQVGLAVRWGGRGGLIGFAGGYLISLVLWLGFLAFSWVSNVGGLADLAWRSMWPMISLWILWAIFGSPALVVGLLVHLVARARGVRWAQRPAQANLAAFE